MGSIRRFVNHKHTFSMYWRWSIVNNKLFWIHYYYLFLYKKILNMLFSDSIFNFFFLKNKNLLKKNYFLNFFFFFKLFFKFFFLGYIFVLKFQKWQIIFTNFLVNKKYTKLDKFFVNFNFFMKLDRKNIKTKFIF